MGGLKFLVTEKKSFFSLLIFFFKNVPGVLKRIRVGGFWGVWGAPPRPHPGVARGRKTIHFFL